MAKKIIMQVFVTAILEFQTVLTLVFIALFVKNKSNFTNFQLRYLSA